MDIPIVLGEISEGIYLNLYWGPCANSSNSYEQLKDCWPKDNPALPSKEMMEDYWEQNFVDAQGVSVKSSSLTTEEPIAMKVKKIEDDLAKIKSEIKTFNDI